MAAAGRAALTAEPLENGITCWGDTVKKIPLTETPWETVCKQRAEPLESLCNHVEPTHKTQPCTRLNRA